MGKNIFDKNLLSPDIEQPVGLYAAVILLINYINGQPFLIVTRRSTFVRSHKGQISFPGGKGEPQDKSVLETALREAEEELGVSSSSFEVLGRLPEVYSISGLRVFPFIVRTENLCVNPECMDKMEVDAIFQIPLHEVAAGQEREFQFMAFGRWRSSVYYETSVVRVWGLTAQILKAAAPFTTNL